MGIPAPFAELILFEHCHRPFGGRMVQFGRSSIYVDAHMFVPMFNKYGINVESIHVEYDNYTQGARDNPTWNLITDETFFYSLGINKVDTIDHDQYEQANIVFDLNQPFGDAQRGLFGAYDLVLNSSVFDNIFDPATAIKNASRLAKPGGRIIHIEFAGPFGLEYLMYSPDWFFDYYAINEFSDCKIYIAGFPDVDQLLWGPWTLYGYKPIDGERGVSTASVEHKGKLLIVIAEKGKDSTWDRAPIQWCYRGGNHKTYKERARIFDENSRPLFNSQTRWAAHNTGLIDCGVIDRTATG